MSVTTETLCIAFEGSTRIASGRLADVAIAVKAAADRKSDRPVLVFDDLTSQTIELDLRGDAGAVVSRLEKVDPARPEAETAGQPARPRGPGRPKLGVVSREVTLLPRHWAWLAEQPGGASVTLRKLVEQARRSNADIDRRRKAQEAAYRFMSVMAGNEPGFEEAIRALFAGDASGFERQVEPWPQHVRQHAVKLAVRTFDRSVSSSASRPTHQEK